MTKMKQFLVHQFLELEFLEVGRYQCILFLYTSFDVG
jgi:hypothetical protein